MSDDAKPAPYVTVTYSRQMPPDTDFPRGYGRRCEADDPLADLCIIKIGDHEFRFGRSTFDLTRWDSARDTLEWALQHAFDQGRAAQRQIIRDALGMPNAWGGDRHGKSGT